mmetsp:Transcript_8870/g.12046  ORF Transcript_8870/g.12046 Transcript_8870/m.12046 type:complete len:588 (-) Transcript_8870:145-1908(-)|eukprot:CAMPEP_0196576946 /NCGR_PEP_ID=MMETSP1081-20130531/6099_1 /TAXON_ID=36882 /ORGANISM="Pyramimonas amylifera, Strain CCMP720" /LENGTH=587 /DNA_ID=CAMNT_0041895695 /DNA_START=143 /DNA_END=1906 /DNA_ORIENTATION=+
MVADASKPAQTHSSDIFENEDAYVSDLLSYSLERLNKEPELLQGDAERLQRSIQVVAVDHYRAFITAADCVKSVHSEVQAVDAHLACLLDALPALEQGCREFVSGAGQITAGRSTNTQMLACHSQMLELLEVPQLMDTCVRNGNYDETLDLQAFASKLAVIHSDLPIVKALQKEVAGISAGMLSQLLQRLQSSIHLPECLRMIGYLRRMAVFNEREMRVTFLRCREAWFCSVVAELDRSAGAYDFLKRLTDAHRMHLFDVVMQFRAIFADDSSSAEGTGGSAGDGGDTGLLYSWAMHRVSLYLSEVQHGLASITEGSVLASLLEHCMYCAMSLGRVGLDFRGLLAQLFLPPIHDLVANALKHARTVFTLSLSEHKWVALPAVTSESMFYAGAEEGSGPPYSLMEFPPVAIFTNGVLAALNELRPCAPIALRHKLAQALQDTLTQAVAHLIKYHATHTLQDAESILFHLLVRGMSETAVPYLTACFARIYSQPSSASSATSGVGRTESGGGGDATAALLNVGVIVQPLKELLLLRATSESDLGPEEEEEQVLNVENIASPPKNVAKEVMTKSVEADAKHFPSKMYRIV